MRAHLPLLVVGLTACADPPLDPPLDGASRQCVAGARRCVGSSSQLCTEDGLWSVPQGCGPTMTCIDGYCGMVCGDACTPGTSRCAPEGMQTCEAAMDGCGRWSAPAACDEGEACRDGRCRADCASCEPGARRCAGPREFTSCVDATCPAWASPTACGAAEACSGGECVPAEECEDRCQDGLVSCTDARTEQRCERLDTGCLDWAAPSACPDGIDCLPGQGCEGDCPPAECGEGDVRCDQGGLQRCVAGGDGCLTWGAIEDCGDGRVCEDGACVGRCRDECSPGERRCGDGGVQTCEATADCAQWSAATPCGAGTACQGNGVCAECRDGESELRPCARCGTQRRRCGPDGWGAWGACEDQGACEAGAQERCGCGTRTCSAQCEWGACSGQGACTPGERRDCGECGFQVCSEQCQWGGCGNGDGTLWRSCNACGWQFCCPNGNWCNCAAHFPDRCAGRQCVGAGVCQ